MAFAQIQLLPGPSLIRPTLPVPLGTKVECIVTILDSQSHPIDLTPYCVPYGESNDPGGPCPLRQLPFSKGMLFTVRSHINQCVPTIQTQVFAEGDPVNGQVRINFEPCNFCNPGLYLAEIALITDQKIVVVYNFYVEVPITLTWRGANAPITIEEVRLWSRDNSPNDNYLLDEVEFKDTEIVAAMRRVVDLWNSTPPVMGLYTYNTTNFPYRSQWIDATIGYLMNIAYLNYLRNGLPSQAAGVAIDDKWSKYAPYKAESDQRLQQFREWMMMMKVQLNAEQGWGSIGYRRLP